MAILQILLILGSLATGTAAFLVLCLASDIKLPIQPHFALAGSIVMALFTFTFALMRSRKVESGLLRGNTALSVLTITGIVTVLAAMHQMSAYISLPADLLSFSESPYVNDIIKLRKGIPIYTPPQDNNSYPYTPGSQILTYGIAAAFGKGDSIPFYRLVQFAYVILASVLAAGVCDLLARQSLSTYEYRNRLLWIVFWLLSLFLLATDPRFNIYIHTLHNDGLALLFSVLAFWLIAKHSETRQAWLIGVMAVLPSLGFLVKQNLLMWVGLFWIYQLISGYVPRRQQLLFWLLSIFLAAVTMGICYLLWEENFIFWIFRALGDKEVSLARSALHLFRAGFYVILGLLGGWMLVLRNGSRRLTALWTVWLLMFGIEVYTSGVGWQVNHLGPGIVLAGCWFMVALVRGWAILEDNKSRMQYLAQQVMGVSGVICLLGGLGLVRAPRNAIPPDFSRYIADIEKEFDGMNPEKVLMDNGTWIYLRENVLMKDRCAPVTLHAGKNQPEINHAMLAATIKRIENKTYDKILARQVEPGEGWNTWYDYQDRGSGVKDAILVNYREIRRIPGVQGIREEWWLKGLIAEVLIFVPMNGAEKLSDHSGTRH